MTELERARAHLLSRQLILSQYRKYLGKTRGDGGIVRQFVVTDRGEELAIALGDRQDMLKSYENAVLAALSWVWEEQEKVVGSISGTVLTITETGKRLSIGAQISGTPGGVGTYVVGISREEARGALKRFDAEAFPRHAFA
jgi:hypothetical protein